MDPILDEFEKVAKGIAYNEPYTPIYLNRTGALADSENSVSAAYWRSHLRNAVCFEDTMNAMHSAGTKLFLEIGPSPVLSGMARRFVEDKECRWIPSLRSGDSEWKSTSKALADLYVVGTPIDWSGFDQGYVRKKVLLPTYAYQRQSYWRDNCRFDPEGYVPRSELNSLHVNDLSALLYDVSWEKIAATTDSGSFSGHVLILADRNGVGSILRDKLEASASITKVTLIYAKETKAAGDEQARVCSDPLSTEQITQMLQTSDADDSITAIVDLWTLDLKSVSGNLFDAIEEQTMFGCGHILTYVKALANLSATPKIFVVTCGAQPVKKEVFVEVTQAPSVAFARVISLEHADMWGGLIDLDPQKGPDEQADSLLWELNCDDAEDQIAYRDGARHALRLSASKSLAPEPVRFKGDATYLITGGLGGVLKNNCRWMIEQGAVHLVLTSRRGLPPREQWQQFIEENEESSLSRNIEFVQELESKGAHVQVEAVDVCDMQAISQVIQKLATAINNPLAGVIHGAGTMTASNILNLPLDDLKTVLRPKTVGGWNLHLATQHVKLDFFVLFSSISAVWGSNQLAHYSAANHFLDALAHHRRATGHPALAINWGLLQAGGMTTDENEKFSKAMGLSALSVDQINRILGVLIDADVTQKLAAVVDWTRFKSLYEMKGEKPLLTRIQISGAPSSGVGELSSEADGAAQKPKVDGVLIAELRGLTTIEERKQCLLQYTVAVTRQVLGFEDGEIDVHGGLFEIGYDSLMSQEFKQTVEDALGADLPTTLVFDYPSLDAMSDYISSEVLPDLLRPKEEEGLVAGNAIVDLSIPAHMTSDTPIAVVGMSCRFAGGANSPLQFWQLLLDATDCITEGPVGRWDFEALYDPDPNVPGKCCCKSGGFIEDVDLFDASFFKISAKEAAAMDPQQRMLLELTWQAVEDAGVLVPELNGTNTGVFLGMGTTDYAKLIGGPGHIKEINEHYGTGNSLSIAAGRLSFFFGLQGPCIAVNTACSSTLVSTHLACTALRNNECCQAITGGVNLLLNPEMMVNLSQAHMLSPTGRCHTFDKAADGYVRGEGGAMLVLKPEAAALSSRDSIYAVIRGSATNHDGHSSGLTVPNGPSQQAVIKQAIERACISPDMVSYIEAHGTGTHMGDPIEVNSINGVFGGRTKPLYLGTVKTNIGHLESASGIAALCKTVLAVHFGQIPAHLHLKEVNPLISFKPASIIIPSETTAWPKSSDTRVAGVSAFGFGGTNAHVLVGAAASPLPGKTTPNQSTQNLFSLSAPSPSALSVTAKQYVQFLSSAGSSTHRLSDICYTANFKRKDMAHRLAVSVDSKLGLLDELTKFCDGKPSTALTVGVGGDKTEVAFLFTGQGSQYINMGKELYGTHAVFRDSLDQCNSFLQPLLAVSIIDVLYPQQGQTSTIDETKYTQPCVFAFEYALSQLWMSWGVKPSYVMGHSVGEYVAACVAGIFSLEDACKLIAARANLMGGLPLGEGEMVAVFTDLQRCQKAIEPYSADASVGAANGPKLTVISGKTDSINKVVEELSAEGIKSKKLVVSHAFHSPMMDSILPMFEMMAMMVAYKKPTIPFVSNVTGKVVLDDSVCSPEYWKNHIRQPVLFQSSIQAAKDLGCELFLEVGPQPVLIGMGKRCAPNYGVWVPSLQQGQEDQKSLLRGAAALYTSGVDIDLEPLLGDQSNCSKLHLPYTTFDNGKRVWFQTERDVFQLN
jgi:acyl transferase domain-containing protein